LVALLQFQLKNRNYDNMNAILPLANSLPCFYSPSQG